MLINVTYSTTRTEPIMGTVKRALTLPLKSGSIAITDVLSARLVQ